MHDAKPKILIIDDEPDDQRPLVLELDGHVDADVAAPEEVTQERLDAADLVLVDYRLTNWHEVAESDAKIPIARRPVNGFALIAVLRAHAEYSERPKAFALRTGHLQEISRPSRRITANTRSRIATTWSGCSPRPAPTERVRYSRSRRLRGP
jgi:hypothetical protein